jgi:RNA-directed DNA polymerase
VTWQEYETGLEDRLVDLHNRVHRGAYQARPSRRVYIPKADGRQRPLGVAALEDKIVQQAVVTILNQIIRGRLQRLLLTGDGRVAAHIKRRTR